MTKRRSDCIIERRVSLHLQLHATPSSVSFDGIFPEQAAIAHHLPIAPQKSTSSQGVITLGLSQLKAMALNKQKQDGALIQSSIRSASVVLKTDVATPMSQGSVL